MNLLSNICKTTTLCLFFLFFTITQSSISQQLAFPTARGAGAYVKGGRGQEVYHVTNLNDNGKGSLRDGLSENNRTILFDVSGVINLTSKLNIANKSNITIAGQSAPDGGITIDGEQVHFQNVQNVIIRYIRFKGGIDSKSFNDGPSSSFQAKGNSLNQIFDHCSFAFGFFQGGSWYEASGNYQVNNLTVQRCFFAENDRGVLSGTISGGKSVTGKFSFISNAFYNVSHRVPNISGDKGRIDVINNIVWYVKNRLMQPNGSMVLNHIGNYYNYNNTPVTDYMFHNFGANTGVPKIFTNGNKYVAINTEKPLSNSISQVNSNNELAFKYFVGKNYGDQIPSEYFTNNQHVLNGEPFKVLSADQALIDVSNNVGCNSRLNADGSVSDNLDTLDTEWLNNIKNGVYTKERMDPSKWNVPKINSIKRPNDFYISNPHIPEAFFKARVPQGQGHNDIAPSGYTWLEEYLNGVDRSNDPVAAQSVEVTPSKQELQVSKTLQLAKTYTPANATNQKGTWTSSNEGIAKVNTNGLVTGISIGKATITFTAVDGNVEGKSEITVFLEALQASAGIDQQICQGSSITLTATGGATYLWSTGETTAIIKVTPDVTTTYTVTAYDGTGKNSDTDDVKVTVNPLPTVDAGNNITINSGESTTLTATGATTYEWSTGATSASITVSPTATKTYTVTGIKDGCEATDTVKVTVRNSVEVIANAGVDQNICKGSSATLTAIGGATYLWSTGETTASIKVTPDVTTTYTVTAYDGTGKNSDTDDVKVTVNPLPTVDAGNNITISSGESATLTATGATTYEWSTGATGASITVSPTATKTYTVTGTTNGCEATDKVTVTVKSTTKVVAKAGPDQNICNGSSTTLTATGGDTYLWSTGAKTKSITVNPTSTAKYSVTAFVGDVSGTDEVVVYVDAKPNVIIKNGSEATILEGEFITLSANGANSYKWSNGATKPNIAVSPRVTESFEVTGYVNDCAAQKSITVNVFEKVKANAGDDVTICRNDNTILTASGPDNTEYLWSTGETTKSITVDPKEDTEYSVMVYHALDSDTDNVIVKVENCKTPEQIIEESTELTDDSTELEFLIHPNPTHGEVNIKISGLTNLSSIHLYDLSGKSLYNETINEGDQQRYEKSLDLSDYASGIYLLQLVDNERVITKKVILR